MNTVREQKGHTLTGPLALLIAAITGVVGVLHLAWAAGSTVPMADAAALVRAVVGRRGMTQMPSPAACLFVAGCLFAAAVLALALGGQVDLSFLPGHKWLIALGGAVVSFVFLARGIVGVLPAFERALPEQPFLRLNRLYYSPLCILIGAGFLYLTLTLPNWNWRLAEMAP
jgi:Protein of unknown function (DUF3995)